MAKLSRRSLLNGQSTIKLSSLYIVFLKNRRGSNLLKGVTIQREYLMPSKRSAYYLLTIVDDLSRIVLKIEECFVCYLQRA